MNLPSAIPPGQAKTPPPVWVTNWFSTSKLCQLVENLDEASAKVALIAYEQQPGVVLHTPAPGRPALNGEINPIVVGVAVAESVRPRCSPRRRDGYARSRELGDRRHFW